VQGLAKAPQRLARGGRARVCVDLHRDRLVGMPKDSHDHARMHIEIDEQYGTCVPRIMNGDRTSLRSLLKTSYWTACRGSEKVASGSRTVEC
jgi:hypothetical protein